MEASPLADGIAGSSRVMGCAIGSTTWRPKAAASMRRLRRASVVPGRPRVSLRAQELATTRSQATGPERRPRVSAHHGFIPQFAIAPFQHSGDSTRDEGCFLSAISLGSQKSVPNLRRRPVKP
jgi:hypothetical protein